MKIKTEDICTKKYTPEQNFNALFTLFSERFEEYGQDDLIRQIKRYWSPAQRLALFDMLQEYSINEDRSKLDCLKKVKVYRNITKGNLSIQLKGLVKARTQFVALTNVQFKINYNGQKKVRQTKQKNVHAFVTGNLFESVLPTYSIGVHLSGLTNRVLQGHLKWSQVHYNPHVNDTFVDNCGQAVHYAEYAFVAGNGQMWVLR